MKKLVIIGAGGLGRQIAWIVERINNVDASWELLGFIDDNKALQGEICGRHVVLGGLEWIEQHKGDVYVACAIGSSQIRKKVINNLDGAKFATLIDPSVIMSDRVEIGEGSIICAGSILTVDILIGSHVFINWDCTVGHDAELKDFVTLYPSVNVSGNVSLNKCVEMGAGSQVIQGLEIAENTIIGAGAVVVKDLHEPGTYVGVPARKLS